MRGIELAEGGISMALVAGRVRESSIPVAKGSDQLVWYFFRVTGVLLVGLVFSHLFITHYLHAPSETTFDFVSKRYANPLWRAADWALLLTALWHGILGARISVNDYIKPHGCKCDKCIEKRAKERADARAASARRKQRVARKASQVAAAR